jgi:hypothetical protein
VDVALLAGRAGGCLRAAVDSELARVLGSPPRGRNTALYRAAVRKAASEDFLEAVSGTNGLAGAADATLVLKRPRGEADGVLYITGRDVDEAEHALRFAPETGTWALIDGPALDYAVSATRAAILRHLRARPGDGLRGVADATGIGYETVKKTCQRMAADGQLTTDTTGRYRPADTPGTGTPESVPGVPGVPEPLLNCGDEIDERGHGPGTAVPGVPARVLAPVAANAADRLARGESVPGGPGACATCGHLTLWHGMHGQCRNKLCTKCDCPAYTTRSRSNDQENPQRAVGRTAPVGRGGGRTPRHHRAVHPLLDRRASHRVRPRRPTRADH